MGCQNSKLAQRVRKACCTLDPGLWCRVELVTEERNSGTQLQIDNERVGLETGILKVQVQAGCQPPGCHGHCHCRDRVRKREEKREREERESPCSSVYTDGARCTHNK